MTGDPVRGKASVPLEIEECPSAVRSEHAVDPAGIEAETS
jgi:hypothetical protein